jgi:hypothetical protein
MRSIFFEVSPRYWEVIIESRTSRTGICMVLDMARAIEVFPVPGGPTKRSFPLHGCGDVGGIPGARSRCWIFAMTASCSGCADKIFHSLLHFLGCKLIMTRSSAPRSFRLHRSASRAVHRDVPWCLHRVGLLHGPFYRPYPRNPLFRNKKLGLDFSSNNDFPSLFQEPLGSRFECGDAKALSKILVRYKGVCRHLLVSICYIPSVRLITPSLT